MLRKAAWVGRRVFWVREQRSVSTLVWQRVGSVTWCWFHSSRPWLLSNGLGHCWDVFHATKFLDLAHVHSLSLSPKLLSEGQKIDVASCTNSGGLVLTTYSTALRETQGLHFGSVGRNAELISDVCHEHKIEETQSMQDTCTIMYRPKPLVFFWSGPKGLL